MDPDQDRLQGKVRALKPDRLVLKHPFEQREPEFQRFAYPSFVRFTVVPENRQVPFRHSSA